MNFKRRNQISQLWDCVCETCKEDFVINVIPKNWKYKILLENNKPWSSEFAYEDLILYCSQECKDKALE